MQLKVQAENAGEESVSGGDLPIPGGMPAALTLQGCNDRMEQSRHSSGLQGTAENIREKEKKYVYSIRQQI